MSTAPPLSRNLNPADFARRFLPHYFRLPFNQMHEFSFRQYLRQTAQVLPNREGLRLAIAAPRGSAKSTVHSLLLPVMDILYRRERHIIIISATEQQAVTRLGNITRELRHNPDIREAFFQGITPPVSASRRCLTLDDIRVEAFGCGSEIRGISFGEYRPTRIILDDVEASRNALVAYRRSQLLDWYDEVIENLGDTYTHITVVGTILHAQSLLSTMLERPNYEGKIFRSIIRWSPRRDLWNRWSTLYTDRADAAREDSAELFFRQHQDTMLQATQVLWPEKEPYIYLERLRLVIGRAAFAKEKQNAPFNRDGRVFHSSRWQRFAIVDGCIQMVRRAAAERAYCDDLAEQTLEPAVDDGGTDGPGTPNEMTAPAAPIAPGAANNNSASAGEHPAPPTACKNPPADQLCYYGFWDPAGGRSATRDGDYAAIVTVAQEYNNRDIFYVMDVWMEKAEPSVQIQRALQLHAKYNYMVFGYESNGFQHELGKSLDDAQRRGGFRHGRKLFSKAVNNTASKLDRIAALEPAIFTGGIVFHEDLPEEFFAQADEFGNPRAHDDGLDALASCIGMIRTQTHGTSGIRRVRGRSDSYR